MRTTSTVEPSALQLQQHLEALRATFVRRAPDHRERLQALSAANNTGNLPDAAVSLLG